MTQYKQQNAYSNTGVAAPQASYRPASPYAQQAPYPPMPPPPPSSSYGQPVYPASMLGSAPLERPVPAKKRMPMTYVYLAGWATLAVGAVVYIGALAWQNDSPAGMRQDLASGTQSMERLIARNSADVADLQRSVGSLESDMQRVKTNAQAQDAREKQLVERVGAIETRVEHFASALPLITTKAQANLKAAEKAKAPTQVAAAPTTPAKTVQQLANAGAAAIETGSIANDGSQRELAAARAAPPTVVAQKSVGVQIASGPSLDALRLSWSLLSDRHKPTLKALEPRYVSGESGLYKLVAGPITNDAEAVKICATLRARGVSCSPAEFKGEGL